MRPLLAVLVVLASVVVEMAPAGAEPGRLTGQVVAPTGAPVEGAEVTAGGVSDTTDGSGRFLLEGVDAGDVTVERLAYADRTVAWDGTADWLTIPIVPRALHGIHVAGWVAADPARWDDMLDIVDGTTVDALVVDAKNENGHVYAATDSDVVEAVGSAASDTYDMADVVSEAHARGAYVITRVVTFQDPIVAAARPGWAVIDGATGAPFDKGGQKFLDPTDVDARAFALDLAEEMCRAGVDEVQFDYVRFPDGDLTGALFDGPAGPAGRIDAITTFLAEARALLRPMGCATAADIFGWITHTPGEGGIGQHLESLAGAVDVLSPMIYPSHYSSGWYGFDVPNDHPGPIVTHAARDGRRRLAESDVVLRPWIQDFWYSAGQVRTQIFALDELGLGWMSWNILSEFTVGAYPDESALTAGTTLPSVTTRTLGTSGFWDVPDGHLFAADIGWIAGAGVTRGCNPPYGDFFCPDRPVTRGEMAAFLVRGLEVGEAADAGFVDDDWSVFEDDISRLAAAGITKGCDPPANTRFCPDRPVTRGEMAAFLRRALSP